MSDNMESKIVKVDIRKLGEPCTINCWYFGPHNVDTDSHMVVCSRTSGVSDYYAEWRYVHAEKRFVLNMTSYDKSHPKVIHTAKTMSEVMHYIMMNIHPLE